MDNQNVDLPREKIFGFCKKWSVGEFALFGSVLRDDFSPESDVDVLVTFKRNAKHTLFDLVNMREELKVIFGREVHLVSRRGLESSRNHLRRNAILNSVEIIYAT